MYIYKFYYREFIYAKLISSSILRMYEFVKIIYRLIIHEYGNMTLCIEPHISYNAFKFCKDLLTCMTDFLLPFEKH